jgi:cytochrome oxidase Cu insertion factor (SCO1/SenC/PrrC family)
MAARRTVLITGLAVLALAGGTLAAGMQARGAGTGAARGAERAAAPALVGQRAGGGEFSLRDLAGAPAVLVFYRGAYCPLCVRRLEALAAHAPAYERAGARVVAVTADGPDAAHETARALGGGVTIV